MGTTHLGAPWWIALPSKSPSGTFLAQVCLLVQKKSPKSFAAFGLRLVLISCEVKKEQKTTTGTGHYVNKLVLENDIKLL